MNKAMATCLSDPDLDRLHAEEMDPAEAEQARAHLASCPNCAGRSAGLLAEHANLLDRVRALGRTVNLDASQPARSASARPSAAGEADCRLQIGDAVGPYKLLETLGEGGFGVVYLAEQREPIRRRVALKILKPGMDSRRVIARFKAEEQALAMMEHPCIARVLDAGTTSPSVGSLPYFAMEHVAGVPITDYCDLHTLSTQQRLDLFMLVCDAVQHAHQKGVIHRDLKPSNVLVTVQDGQPTPKVIDFGVAKAVSQRLTEQTVFTEQGQLIGTPEYMSPEQAEMSGLNIDTRTDIYSLGVLLYELLVGALPFDPKSLRQAGYSEIQRIIREQDPPKPSTRLSGLGGRSAAVAHQRRTDLMTLAGQLRGDLDWITMRAMEKDRTRRYSSASEMAADIRRHMNNEPVLASPPSAAYRVRKFIRRHRLGVAAAAAVGLALVLGIASTTTMAVVASRQREAALAAWSEARSAREAEHHQREAAEENAESTRREAAKVEAVNQFLRGMLSSADPREKGRDITVREVLDQAAKQAEEGSMKDQPEIEALVRTTLGQTYEALGLYPSAELHLRTALDLRRRAGDRSVDTARSLNNLAALLHQRGNAAEAVRLCRQSLDILREMKGPRDAETLTSISNLAYMLQEQGKHAEAEPLAREALASRRAALGDRHVDVAFSLNNLATLRFAQGDVAEAASLLREALDILQSVHGREHPNVLTAMNNLASLLKKQGNREEAERLEREVLSLRRKLLGDEHPDVAASLNNLAQSLASRGAYRDAVPLLQEAASIFRSSLGNDHPSLAVVSENLAVSLLQDGDYLKADPAFREALAIRRKQSPQPHVDWLDSLVGLGECLELAGERIEAESLLRECLAICQEKSTDDWRCFQAESVLGAVLTSRADYEEAEQLLLKGHAGLQDHPPAKLAPQRTAAAARRLVRLYDAWGKPEKAAQWRSKLSTAAGADASSQPSPAIDASADHDNPAAP
jgi:serine/threonine protein kinase/tetratricopeptide (TPR) repeat protein